ncbi:MFS transporter [Mesorhizobium carmichaelinearum]|uniref:MFS transporter n=1 Tax=Mesorhizobium carmichaelinearum TaxID=1208188 RepID=UPI000BA485C3|nr:MFS transporter [Mesorhizobium carmichaelinearum]
MTQYATSGMEAVLHGPEKPDERSGRAWGAVISLALGTFGLATAEVLPAAVLTPLMHGLGVTAGEAGQALTATAIAAAIAAPTMALITKRLDRRTIICAMTLLQILSNVLSALAWSLPLLLTGRVVLGIALGGFWSISASLAGRLVPSHLLPRALLVILTGVSIAHVCAGPFGVYVGDRWGWQAPFIIVAALGAATLVVQLMSIPRLPPVGVKSLRSLLNVANDPTIKVALVVILLAASGHFAGLTYMRPFLEQVPALDSDTIWRVLLAFGVVGLFGNFAGSFLARYSLKAIAALAPLLIAIAAASLVMVGASALAATVAVLLWGFAFGAVPVALQTWVVLRAAPGQAESAGVLMTATFQVAIAAGASFGGLLAYHVSLVSVFGYSAVATCLAALTVFLLGPKRET